MRYSKSKEIEADINMLTAEKEIVTDINMSTATREGAALINVPDLTKLQQRCLLTHQF